MGNIYLISAILCGVMSQLIVKWRITLVYSTESIPYELFNKIVWFITNVLLDTFIMLSLILTFMGGILWMLTLNKLELSFAYPFTSLSYVIVLVSSCFLFNEPINLYKIVGIVFILIGVIISSQG